MNYSVKAAARATGVSESRLRTWERRYGIPKPGRSATSRRLYDENDLALIRKMVALVEAGLAASDAAEALLRGEEYAVAVPVPQQEHPTVAVLVASADAYDEEAFLAALSQAVAQSGWGLTLDEIVFPAMRKIGLRWESATLPPAKEHFASELVRRRLASALDALGPSLRERPQLVMACPEAERHDLGLLALALLLRMQGVNVVFLGADVPTIDMIEACQALEPDAVCLSASSGVGLASLVRASRSILARHPVHLFIGGPALSPSGTTAAGVQLPEALTAAAMAIVRRLSRSSA
jgi:DNA-binding transcriptional MerR regulator/methylmalonyl-CoA mutase cobalamin-binding subunit